MQAHKTMSSDAGTVTAAGGPEFYRPALDGLRLVGISLVFLHHSPKPSALYAVRGAPLVLTFLTNWGWIGVDLFLAISAYLTTTILLREHAQYGTISIRNFHIRRLLRLLPLYYLALFLAAFVFPFFSSLDPLSPPYGSALYHHLMRKNIPLAAVFLHNVAGPLAGMASAFLAPLWVISLEQQFYLFWPFVVREIAGTDRRTQFLTIGLLLLLTVYVRAALYQLHMPHPFLYQSLLPRLDPLLLGALVAIVNLKGGERRSVFVVLAGIAVIALGARGHTIMDVDASGLVGKYLLIAAGLALVLHYVVGSEGLLTRLLSLPAVIWLGRISYGIYVYHLIGLLVVGPRLMQAWLPGIIDTVPGALIQILLSSVVTVLLSALSYYFFERRFLRYKSRFACIRTKV